jgi:hypothetical protein
MISEALQNAELKHRWAEAFDEISPRS